MHNRRMYDTTYKNVKQVHNLQQPKKQNKKKHVEHTV